MGISCCLPIRDDDPPDTETENSHDAPSSTNCLASVYFIINKIKGVFHGNEVHHLPNSLQPREILNTSSSRVHPNSVPKSPRITVTLNKPAASVNRTVASEILDTSSSLDHPIVESGPNQPSEQNIGVGVFPDETATSVNEIVTTEVVNTSSGREHTNVESGHIQISELNPVAEAALDRAAAASVSEEVSAGIINTSLCREHHHQSSEQNPWIDLVPDSNAAAAAATVSDGVSEILNPDSCNVHQIIESVQSPEEGLHLQTEIDSCTKEASPNSDKSFTKADGTFYEVFPSPDEEDVCPTCLEDYEPDNPRIVTECNHHFHLSCIYDWLERSERCPICFRLMVISEN